LKKTSPQKASWPQPRAVFTALTSAVKALALAGILAGLLLAAPGCEKTDASEELLSKSRELWENGHYEDAARGFVSLFELFPESPVAGESLFWAANLYQFYLEDQHTAIKLYQQYAARFPDGRYLLEVKENMAVLFEDDPETRHRALQIYQQLVLHPALVDRRDQLLKKVGLLYMNLGRMDQARQAFRDLLKNHPQSPERAEVYYLVGYSYYLEKRVEMALAAFKRTVKDFAGTPVAVRSQFFIADTLEEKGEMRSALKAFKTLEGRYPHPTILEKRIKTLEARIRRGVR